MRSERGKDGCSSKLIAKWNFVVCQLGKKAISSLPPFLATFYFAPRSNFGESNLPKFTFLPNIALGEDSKNLGRKMWTKICQHLDTKWLTLM